MQGMNFAVDQMKRLARKTIIWAVVVMLVAAGFAFVKMPNFKNLYVERATFEDAYELYELFEDKQIYVEAEAEFFFDTGYQLTEDNKPKYNYYAFWAENQYVICRTKLSITAPEYEDYIVRGKLRAPTSVESRILDRIYSEIAAEGVTRTEAESYVSSYILDTNAPRVVDQVFNLVPYILILLMILRILIVIRNVGDPSRSKVYRQFAGAGEDPENVNRMVSRELESGGIDFEHKPMTVTHNWIIVRSAALFTVHRRENLIWVYKTVTKHRTNGIPTGKTYAVTLCFADKRQESVAAKNEALTDELVVKLATLCPNAISGYTQELDELYNRDHAAFADLAKRASYAENVTNTEQ